MKRSSKNHIKPLLALIASMLLWNALAAQVQSSAKTGKIAGMSWILGKWENVSARRSLFEMWTKANDSTYIGRSFTIVGKDITSAENITLQQRNNELWYVPVVKNQNNGAATRFKMIPSGGAELIFENKEHDFPQRVVYKSNGPDSLYARIEGTYKGSFRKQEFLMKRVR